MAEKKEQKIVVFLSLFPSDKNLILNGIKIATIFKKELCLCFNYSGKQKKNHSEFKAKLIEYSTPIKNEIPGLKVSTLLLSEHLKDIPEKLSDDLEAIFIIAAKSQFRKYSPALTESPVPFLFVDEKKETIPDYKRVVLPIDLRSENSDSALWVSYFGRFNNTVIVVVAANDKIRENKNRVAKNVVLTKKLYQKFNLQHKFFKGQKGSLGVADEALELALTMEIDFLTILGSSTITPLDLLVGLPEKRIIRHSKSLPVLVINPRKDNYILCD
ncbi:universal stress protein [Maribellus maritimus]|uniref:universal stress protein n=1 Tax=Maribellus maritimus TaxID=2870838 RepID=UPI001EEA12EF|nr:universal stress protein [Maribellus maritimus]MCG6190565.1 universal stress protein [Maribellus maritimus]